ncbi:replication protein [Schinkia azotoformans]|uniref:replication protein n=1 Tax=Schinkia azotoformans TaxID=1454 RepID=UPI002DBF0DAA|nr:replication protein [Schinkia azotoformans]MEC1714719.1 replication protein [Schinkia azotoformans]MEC1757525.1 replication protein [Schinkia azotoformans]
MADIQLKNGFLRIATELMNEIIRRDFSKRQLAILHFIIRLSYGCHQKDCLIEKFNAFEIAGLNKSDIKKELQFLRDCRVINWDEKKMVFSINKDYELWQINPTKGYDKEKMDQLIHENLKRKVGETPTEQSEDVGNLPTLLENIVGKTLTDLGEKVGKTLTTRLVKYQLELHGNAWESMDEEVLKDSIIDIYLKINKEEEEKKLVERILDLLQKSRILEEKDITEFLRDDIDDVINNFGFEQPEEMILEAIKDSARGNGKTWKFVYKKLVDWKKLGIKAKEDLENKSEKRAGDGDKVHKYRSGYGGSSGKTAEQALREAEAARRAWGGS